MAVTEDVPIGVENIMILIM